MRFAPEYVTHVLTDNFEDAKTYHLNPFDGLYDLIRIAGIQRYTIWLDGTDLFLAVGQCVPHA